MGYGLAYTGFTVLPYLILGVAALVVGGLGILVSKVGTWRARK